MTTAILGEGIAKIDGITVFVENGIKGEKAKIKILKIVSDFCYAKIIEIIEKSKYRKEPDCSIYNRCGGCNLRHLEYKETLNIKKQIVENCLYKSHVGAGVPDRPKINNTVGMETPLYYRNKLQYPVGTNNGGNPIMGIYADRTHDIVETSHCYIQNELCQQIANNIFEYIKSNNIEPYNEKTLKGVLRHIVIKIGIKTNEIMVILVVNNALPLQNKFIKYLTQKHPQIKTIIKNTNNKNTNIILGEKNEIIYGNGYIYDILGEYKFKISPHSFYQTNPIQTEKLYNKAIEYALNNNYINENTVGAKR